MNALARPRRAIVYGLGTSITNNVREYHEGEDEEVTLIRQLVPGYGDAWFVLCDGETETRVRRVRRML